MTIVTLHAPLLLSKRDLRIPHRRGRMEGHLLTKAHIARNLLQASGREQEMQHAVLGGAVLYAHIVALGDRVGRVVALEHICQL